MLNLKSQADAIKAQLATVSSMETVIYLDEETSTRRHPATLPAAYIALGRAAFERDGNAKSIVTAQWSVLVKTKKMTGGTGAMELIDDIFDSLYGFRVTTGAKPLRGAIAEYMKEEGGSISYLITFETTMPNIGG